MNQDLPIQTTETPPSVTSGEKSVPMVNFDPKSSSKNKGIVLILILLIIGLLVLLVYLFYQNMQLKQQVGLMEHEKLRLVACKYNGQIYGVGKGFVASDGCNTCSCDEDGEVTCTEMACGDNEDQSQVDLVNDWVTYRNEDYGFEFKYPSDLFWKPIEGISFFSKTEVDVDTLYPDPYTESKFMLEIHENQTLSEAIASFKYPDVGFDPEFTNLTINGYQAAETSNLFIITDNNLSVWLRCKANYQDSCRQILSTFRFDIESSDQIEGKFCGGIAANLPENQCPDGYVCKLDGKYPDAGGVCTKSD